MEPVIGLDFGTTNSAIAVADSDGRARLAAFADGPATRSTAGACHQRHFDKAPKYHWPDVRGRRYIKVSQRRESLNPQRNLAQVMLIKRRVRLAGFFQRKRLVDVNFKWT